MAIALIVTPGTTLQACIRL